MKSKLRENKERDMRISLTPTCGESEEKATVVFTQHRCQMYRATRRCRKRLKVRKELQFRRLFFDIRLIEDREN